MSKYGEPIGRGGFWIREGKKGKYLSWTIKFPINGNIPILVSGVAFKNDEKQGQQPDYHMIVNEWKYPDAKEEKEKPSSKEEDIPF